MKSSSYFGRDRVTRILAVSGIGTATILFFAGIYIDLFFFVIMLLILWGAVRELGSAEAEALVRTLMVKDALTKEYESLLTDDDLLEKIDTLLESPQRDFPVLNRDGNYSGLLTRTDLAKGIGGGRTAVTVEEILQKRPTGDETLQLSSDQSLSSAIEYMMSHNLSALPVLEKGKFIGLLKLSDAQHVQLQQSAQDEAVRHSEFRMF